MNYSSNYSSDLAFPFIVYLGTVLAWLAGMVVAGYFVWNNAPAAGGEFWPYIRVVAVIVGAIIGGKISAFIGFVASVIVAAIVEGLI